MTARGHSADERGGELAVTLHDHFDGRITLRVAQPQPQYGTVQLNAEYKGNLISVDVNLASLLDALATTTDLAGFRSPAEVERLLTAARAEVLREAARDAANAFTEDSARGYAIWLWNTTYADALVEREGER